MLNQRWMFAIQNVSRGSRIWTCKTMTLRNNANLLCRRCSIHMLVRQVSCLCQDKPNKQNANSVPSHSSQFHEWRSLEAGAASCLSFIQTLHISLHFGEVDLPGLQNLGISTSANLPALPKKITAADLANSWRGWYARSTVIENILLFRCVSPMKTKNWVI